MFARLCSLVLLAGLLTVAAPANAEEQPVRIGRVAHGNPPVTPGEWSTVKVRVTADEDLAKVRVDESFGRDIDVQNVVLRHLHAGDQFVIDVPVRLRAESQRRLMLRAWGFRGGDRVGYDLLPFMIRPA